MIHLFLNGLAASAGGGLTYLRNVVPRLAERDDIKTTVAVSPMVRREFDGLARVNFVEMEVAGGAGRRFWEEQRALPAMIRKAGAEVLISAGNFALRKSPVPQILLSRNSLYTSADFYRDLRSRRDYKLWLDTRLKASLAKRSIAWADCTVAPSAAFAEELRRWTGREIRSIHHGFDRETFYGGTEALAPAVQERLDAARDSLKLLFVSHYNYYRNFETLLRAMPLLRERFQGRVKLVLTCSLRSEANPGAYRAESAAALVRNLGIGDLVVELGSVPYHLLHHVYRACDVYVTPAYAESFAHPLVEAMSSGLPVIASDIAVHREICGRAALFFDRFSATDLAEKVLTLAERAELRVELSERGLRRAGEFSWARHVDELVKRSSVLGR
jgi:glycosyltransferase involved in cell wall biosynthesis